MVTTRVIPNLLGVRVDDWTEEMGRNEKKITRTGQGEKNLNTYGRERERERKSDVRLN